MSEDGFPNDPMNKVSREDQDIETDNGFEDAPPAAAPEEASE